MKDNELCIGTTYSGRTWNNNNWGEIVAIDNETVIVIRYEGQQITCGLWKYCKYVFLDNYFTAIDLEDYL